MSVRIVNVIVGLDVGGAEMMLKRLVESQLPDSNYRHTVVSLTTLGKVGRQLQGLGVDVHALNISRGLSAPLAVWRLSRLFRRLRPDIVQTWMYHADLVGGIASRLAGCRNVIWGIRTTHIAKGGSRATRVVRRLCARLSCWVPQAIVCAAEAAQRLHIGLGYSADRMVVIPNGFDVVQFKPCSVAYPTFREALGIEEGHVLIGHAGRWCAEKDHLGFVKAAGELARRAERCRFLMVGRGIDKSNESLVQAIQSTGYADRFVLIGERHDMPKCLAAMDIFCLSSRTEGFPNVVGEAMACAVPCVVTDVGDARLIVGDTGWVVAPEDYRALANALSAAVLVPTVQRQAQGLLARARIVHEFSMERAVQRFDALYKKVVEQT